MEIVIKIPEKVYKALAHTEFDANLVVNEMRKSIANGTPQPKVIRCKDCKHWTNNIGDSKLRDNYCNEKAHGFHYQCSGDDYCSFAESEDE